MNNQDDEIEKIKEVLRGKSKVKLTQGNSPKEKISHVKPKLKQSSLGKNIVFRGENKRKFEELRQTLLEELSPRTKIQEVLADKFIFLAWESERAMAIERDLLSKQNLENYKKEVEESWDSKEEYDLDSYRDRLMSRLHGKQKRLRKMRRINLNTPEIKEVIQYQSHLQKEMRKVLDRIRAEQSIG